MPADGNEGVLGASRLEAAMRGNKRGQQQLVETDRDGKESLHVRLSGSWSSRVCTSPVNSVRSAAKEDSAADGKARTTRPAAAGDGSSRQMWRRRRRSRLRRTAFPRDLRRTKTTPEGARPRRIQRSDPFDHGIGRAARGWHYSDGQTLATPLPATRKDGPPGGRAHALSEAVLVLASPLARLIGPLHDDRSWKRVTPYLLGDRYVEQA